MIKRKTNVIISCLLLFLSIEINSCNRCEYCYYSSVEGVFTSPNDTVFWFFGGLLPYFDSAQYYRSKGYSCDSIIGISDDYYGVLCAKKDKNNFLNDPTHRCY